MFWANQLLVDESKAGNHDLIKLHDFFRDTRFIVQQFAHSFPEAALTSNLVTAAMPTLASTPVPTATAAAVTTMMPAAAPTSITAAGCIHIYVSR